MSCTIATLIACFSWSGLYIDTGVTVQDAGVERVESTRELVLLSRGPLLGGSFIVGSDQTATTVRHTDRSPYGRLALGYDLEFSPSFRLSLEASRVEPIEGGRATNGVTLGARWRPFARR